MPGVMVHCATVVALGLNDCRMGKLNQGTESRLSWCLEASGVKASRPWSHLACGGVPCCWPNRIRLAKDSAMEQACQRRDDWLHGQETPKKDDALENFKS